MSTLKRVVQVLCFFFSTVAAAQTPEPPRPEYGTDITIEMAKTIAAAVLAECQTNKWNVAVAVVNTHGSLVYYERMNNTQSASARSAGTIIPPMQVAAPPWISSSSPQCAAVAIA